MTRFLSKFILPKMLLPILLLILIPVLSVQMNRSHDTPVHAEPAAAVSVTTPEKPTTVLVTGYDPTGNSTDTILIASLDAEHDRLSVLRIPGDCYLSHPDCPEKKISSAYSAAYHEALSEQKSEEQARAAGNRALCEILDRVFGVRVDGYFSIGTDGFRKIVDSVGGVEVNIPKALDYDDDSRNLHIHLPKGKVQLDGDKAEQFVRFRSGSQKGEYGKIDTRNLLLAALFKKLQTDFTLPTALSLITTAYREVDSDLSLGELIPLARAALELDFSEVKVAVMKGEGRMIDGKMCEVVDRKTARDLVNYYLSAGKSESDFDPLHALEPPKEDITGDSAA
ncbi:MAG: LCP family protein [Eubacteriales bacterium]